jgi:hypothetical protein
MEEDFVQLHLGGRPHLSSKRRTALRQRGTLAWPQSRLSVPQGRGRRRGRRERALLYYLVNVLQIL